MPQPLPDFEDQATYKVYRVEYERWPAAEVTALVGYCDFERGDMWMSRSIETMLFMYGNCERCGLRLDNFDTHRECMWTADREWHFIPIRMPGELKAHLDKEALRERVRDGNKLKSQAAAAARKAALDAVGERHTKADVDALFDVQGGRCYYCFGSLHDNRGNRLFAKDHYIAVMRGGGDGIRNIVLTCSGCNSRKTNKHPEDFKDAELRRALLETRQLIKHLQKHHQEVYWPRRRPVS